MWRNRELDAVGNLGVHPSSGVGRRAQTLMALLALTSLAAGAAIVGSTEASAQAPDSVPTPAPVASALSGATSADAAASCWEIKQLFPASVDGTY